MAKQTFTTGQVLTAAQMTSLQQTAMGGGSATAKTASYTLVAADAGATVIMNSASATTITVNTSLFSAGDTVFIQNIGAGVSTITAGTATVNTASSLALAQYESGNLYFTAAGVSIFSKSDGAAAGGSSGMTLIKRASFSAVANTGTTFDDIFTSSYTSYLLVIDSIYSAAQNDDLQMQLRYAGPNTQAALYFVSNSYVASSAASTGYANSSNTAQILLAENSGNSGVVMNGQMYFHNVGNSSQNPIFMGQLTNFIENRNYQFGGGCDAARTYTGVLFKTSSANITGTISIYGLAI